ncbi:hypothetical protein DPEC_G00263880 [Dallia pectoralis]|uniref:Uncharacterized protein n=1 Tax=Dallia pectoralis TaxID=75939 RepID=A0ACC2FSB9_DALPE|nr:hypothetical protein DPEC_G00263880 [Dallia pectoralis]
MVITFTLEPPVHRPLLPCHSPPGGHYQLEGPDRIPSLRGSGAPTGTRRFVLMEYGSTHIGPCSVSHRDHPLGAGGAYKQPPSLSNREREIKPTDKEEGTGERRRVGGGREQGCGWPLRTADKVSMTGVTLERKSPWRRQMRQW